MRETKVYPGLISTDVHLPVGPSSERRGGFCRTCGLAIRRSEPHGEWLINSDEATPYERIEAHRLHEEKDG